VRRGDGTEMRILITGARGFVASHLREALLHVCGDAIELIATDSQAGPHPVFGDVVALDVTDESSVAAAFERHAPTHVIHLAGIAAPSAANADPGAAWRVHLWGALNVGRAIVSRVPECWLLHVGSGLAYGSSARSGLALDEETVLAPVDDYAASKASADLALGAMVNRGLKCIRLRPFNHVGPRQTEAFVIPAFAAQIARIEAGLAPPLMRVGNLDAERDFLDVRDVTRAYALAVLRTSSIESGAIFNIASGVPRRIADVLELLLAQSRVKISVKRDPARLRTTDLPRIVGNSDRAREQLGWSPVHSFEEVVYDVLEDWRARTANS